MDTLQGKQRIRARRLRVGLVLDSPLHVLGLQVLFEDDPWLEMVDTPAEELLRDHTLGIVLIGAQAEASLLGLLTTFHNLRPGLHMIAMGQETDGDHIERMLAAGAKGFLAESASRVEVIRAIETVQDGSVWASRNALSTLMNRDPQMADAIAAETRAETPAKRIPTAHADFTKRQLEVLALLTASHSNREIATLLQIEERTVKSHIAILMRKVGARNRIALSLHALARGLASNRGDSKE